MNNLFDAAHLRYLLSVCSRAGSGSLGSCTGGLGGAVVYWADCCTSGDSGDRLGYENGRKLRWHSCEMTEVFCSRQLCCACKTGNIVGKCQVKKVPMPHGSGINCVDSRVI